ncbi:MAG TPA: DUF2069 domain-containing protein [Casimicrobiaceae bacterium]|nr:DUF2069 domain-containing protein [Casimicrobiaceae bacterium]
MSPSPDGGARWRRAAAASVLALALLELLWELWLAPLKPGGSWLALKAVPLLALAPGVARGRVRARQWTLLLLTWYVAEGVVRAFSDSGRQALCAGAAAALALVALAAGLGWFRAQGRALRPPA